MKTWIVRIVCFALLGVGILLGWARPVSAADSAFDWQMCKHGVHLLSPSDEDFKKAAELVNANGGKNCWVVLVVRQDEMKTANLQRMADLARENHLQIVYRIERGFDAQSRWLMPNRATTQSFIDALAGEGKAAEGRDGVPLNPVSRDVYVVLGNEPTHAAMCGGCTPEQMASWMLESIRMLHAAGERLGLDIHVGMGGQDLASPQAPEKGLYDAAIFMQQMFAAQPDLLCEVDIWVSHNYPRSFVGSAAASGRLSPYGYEWELAFARAHAKPECRDHVEALPVFITETGYRVGPGGVQDDYAYTQSRQIVERYMADPRVKMFSFFTQRYCGEPFEVFALAGCSGDLLNGAGRALMEAPKVEGFIRHVHRARTVVTCPDKLVEGLDVECLISAENLGTDIWQDLDSDYRLKALGVADGSVSRFSRFRAIKPFSKLTSTMHYNPGSKLGKHDITIGIEKDGRLLLGLATWSVETYPAPDVDLEVTNVFGAGVDVSRAQLQVFDGATDEMLHRADINIDGGRGLVEKVKNVKFDTCYRIVLLVDKNLPVQKDCVKFTVGTNYVEMPRLIALDRNSDGKLSLGDILQRYEN